MNAMNYHIQISRFDVGPQPENFVSDCSAASRAVL